MNNFSAIDLTRDYYLADWKCEKIIEQAKEFESHLDSKHQIALRLTSCGSVTMELTGISYQNPDLIYFYGNIDGAPTQLIQHMSQVNILFTSVEIHTPEPARRIGFLTPTNASSSTSSLR